MQMPNPSRDPILDFLCSTDVTQHLCQSFYSKPCFYLYCLWSKYAVYGVVALSLRAVVHGEVIKPIYFATETFREYFDYTPIIGQHKACSVKDRPVNSMLKKPVIHVQINKVAFAAQQN